MTSSTRRGVFGLAGAGVLLAGAAGRSFAAENPLPFEADHAAAADDEIYWAQVADLYDKPPTGVVQLENGQFGAMSRPVRLAYERHTQRVNRETTLYTRTAYPGDAQAVRAKTAAMLGVDVGEIAFTRGATESLQALIGGYNRLRPGDAALYADLDYDSTSTAMRWLAKGRGVTVIKIDLPEPATRQNVIGAYDQAFRANPKLRMVLITHLSHRTGLVLPVRAIADLARARGIDVILDGGHALGQTAFQLADLGVDFAGLNLHKWIGSPLGAGLIYIRKGRLADIDMAVAAEPSDGIESRIHTGTVNSAAFLGVADAIDFQNMLGLDAKARRLRYLRDRWAETARANPKVEVLTPNIPELHAGLTSFRIKGQTSGEQAVATKDLLWRRYKIFTVERLGPAKGAVVRVTPSLINTPQDMDRLVQALTEMTA